MTEIFRIEPSRELGGIYDDESEQWIYRGTYHVIVLVKAKGTDGQWHTASASLRDGLLEQDPRNPETVYSMLERHLKELMVSKGVWQE